MALRDAASSSDALSWAERWLAAKTELADGVGTLLLVFHDPDFVAGGGNWSDGNFGGSGLQPQFEPRDVRRILVGEYEVRYEILDASINVLLLWHTRENR